ncbi:NPC intracellular cholesterol transporter 2 homolog a-like [Glandiceps talaboti]
MLVKTAIFGILCIVGVSSMVVGGTIKFKDCGSKSGKAATVEVDPCPQQPCVLKRGTNETVKITFTPNKAITAIKAVVHGIIADVPVPFPLPNPDGCKDSGLACPLTPNKSYTYVDVLEIKTIYPALQLTIKWELQDQNGDDIVCIEVPARIQ